MVLCGTSILNAFFRGEPSQITVTSAEAVEVLQEASPVCQRCLDRVESSIASISEPKQAPNKVAGRGVPGEKNRLALDARSVLFLQELVLVIAWGEWASIFLGN